VLASFLGTVVKKGYQHFPSLIVLSLTAFLIWVTIISTYDDWMMLDLFYVY